MRHVREANYEPNIPSAAYPFVPYWRRPNAFMLDPKVEAVERSDL